MAQTGLCKLQVLYKTQQFRIYLLQTFLNWSGMGSQISNQSSNSNWNRPAFLNQNPITNKISVVFQQPSDISIAFLIFVSDDAGMCKFYEFWIIYRLRLSPNFTVPIHFNIDYYLLKIIHPAPSFVKPMYRNVRGTAKYQTWTLTCKIYPVALFTINGVQRGDRDSFSISRHGTYMLRLAQQTRLRMMVEEKPWLHFPLKTMRRASMSQKEKTTPNCYPAFQTAVSLPVKSLAKLADNQN